MLTGSATRDRLNFFAILALAAALRLAGINFGLPQVYHQDEPILVNHAMAYGVEGLATKLFLPPPLSTYLLFFCYAAMYLLCKATGIVGDAASFGIGFLRDPSAFYIVGRLVLGWLPGMAAVAMLGRWIARDWGGSAGRWAMLFLALAPLHVELSHYIYMDAPLCAAMIGFYAGLNRWAEGGGRGDAARAGCWWGLAAAFKYTALYFAPVIILVLVIRRRERPLSGLGDALTLGACALAAFFITTPYAFLSWPEFLSQVRSQAGARGFVGWSHHLSYSIVGGGGWGLLAGAALGGLFMARERPRSAAVLGACLLTYYLVNVYFSQEYARYTLPLLPILCALCGLAAYRVSSGGRPALMVLAPIAVAISLAVPSLYGDWLLTRTDTRSLAKRWIEDNLPAGSAIAVDNRFFGPHLRQTPEQIRQKSGYLDPSDAGSARHRRLELALRAAEGGPSYETYALSAEGAEEESTFLFLKPLVRTNEQDLDRAGISYVVLNHSDHDPRKHAFVRSLSGRAERIAEFSPFWDPARRRPYDTLASTAAPHLLKDLLSRKRPGPYLEIYRVDPRTGKD